MLIRTLAGGRVQEAILFTCKNVRTPACSGGLRVTCAHDIACRRRRAAAGATATLGASLGGAGTLGDKLSASQYSLGALPSRQPLSYTSSCLLVARAAPRSVC